MLDEHIHWKAREAGFTEDDVKEGTPCCLSIGSDTYPGTVTAVTRKDGLITRVSVREDHVAGRGSSVFVLGDEKAEVLSFSRRQNGQLVEVGQKIGQGHRVSFGYREQRLDPSF